MSYNYQDAPRESQQEYFGMHTDNKETLQNAFKRIEELEKHNAELLALINAERERQEKCNDIHLRTIADLEKENAELDMKRKAERQIFQGIVEKKNEQLAKAKELIENIIRVTWGEGWNYSLDWKVKAEQFIKE